MRRHCKVCSDTDRDHLIKAQVERFVLHLGWQLGNSSSYHAARCEVVLRQKERQIRNGHETVFLRNWGLLVVEVSTLPYRARIPW